MIQTPGTVMRTWPALILALAVMLGVRSVRAQSTPQNASEAHPAWTYSVASKCPDLHAADDGPAAVVVFYVNDFGAPSQVSVQTSSGTPALDDAAVKCVKLLKFQPRTRLGDGAPVGSWQRIAWRWQRPANAPVAAAVAATAVAAPAVAAAPAGATELRVCADDAGRLMREPTVVHSSGEAGLDAAAVKIARAGSGNYRPAPSVGGKPASGCATLTIHFESR
jgi:TonB family protein